MVAGLTHPVLAVRFHQPTPTGSAGAGDLLLVARIRLVDDDALVRLLRFERPSAHAELRCIPEELGMVGARFVHGPRSGAGVFRRFRYGESEWSIFGDGRRRRNGCCGCGRWPVTEGMSMSKVRGGRRSGRLQARVGDGADRSEREL